MGSCQEEEIPIRRDSEWNCLRCDSQNVRDVLLPRFHGPQAWMVNNTSRNRGLRSSSGWMSRGWRRGQWTSTTRPQDHPTPCLFCQRSVKNTSWVTRCSCSTQSGLHRWVGVTPHGSRSTSGLRKKRTASEMSLSLGRNRYHATISHGKQSSKSARSVINAVRKMPSSFCFVTAIQPLFSRSGEKEPRRCSH